MKTDNRAVVSARGRKNPVDAYTPYHFLQEKERQADGEIRTVNTVFLTNSECPFKCVMCDLWKNTLDTPTPAGAIPVQLTKALGDLPDADVIKLYNSGNFFDTRAIPESDYPAIAHLISGYKRVIVENHPKLMNRLVEKFNNMITGQLEIAMGIETLHPEVLQKLNKNFTLTDVESAAAFLRKRNMDMRAFLLINPPYLTDPDENEHWILASQEKLFELGFSACTLIPTRGGNGLMERLQKAGYYTAPDLETVEAVFERSLSQKRGRVFADTWDLPLFSKCSRCLNKRIERLDRMNLTQQSEPAIVCRCQDNPLKS